MIQVGLEVIMVDARRSRIEVPGAAEKEAGAREVEPLFDHGMTPSDAIKAATSVAARVPHLGDRIGTVRSEVRAEMISVAGDATREISALRKVSLVMKNGVLDR